MNCALNMEPARTAVSNRGVTRRSAERLINRADKPCSAAGECEWASPALAIIASGSGFGFCGYATEQCGGFACVGWCFHYIDKITQHSDMSSIFFKITHTAKSLL